MEAMENSAHNTIRVSHSFHSPYYYRSLLIKREEAKTKTEEKTFLFRKGLDIHIAAVDRARRL